MEVWRKIPDIEDYEVSNLAKVRHIETKEPKRQQPTESGFCVYHTNSEGKRKGYYVKILVAEAFVENQDNLTCVLYIDGNKFNAVWTNLRYVSTNRKAKRGPYKIKPKEKKTNSFVTQMLKLEQKQLDKLNYFKHD